jgi:serine/threonine protein kinase
MWSAGCLLAELQLRQKFVDGNSAEELREAWWEEVRTTERTPSQLCRRLATVDEGIASLILELLKWDHEKRFRAADAIQFPVLADYHDPRDEPVRTPLNEVEFRFTRDIGGPGYGSELLLDMLELHPEFKGEWDLRKLFA